MNSLQVHSKSTVHAMSTFPAFHLYCKAASDGLRVGDCPFTSSIAMAMHIKGIPCRLVPRTSENKDEWHLAEPYKGSMPCLRAEDGSFTIVDSAEIIKFVDSNCDGGPNLAGEGDIGWKLKAELDFFPPVAKYLKNKDPAMDVALEEKVKEKLSQLDALIGNYIILACISLSSTPHLHLNTIPESNGGEFIAGNSMTVVDCFVAGVLYHFQCAVAPLKGKTFEGDFVHIGLPNLRAYVLNLISLPAYQRGVLLYTAEDVLCGWRKAREEI